MAYTPFKIKSSNTTSIPSSLIEGEVAYTANGDVLYIKSNNSIIAIGGKRVPGVLTANQALIANTTGYLDVLKAAGLYIGSSQITSINAVANSTVLGLAANVELPTTWSVKTYVDARLSGVSSAPPGANTQITFNDSGVSNATAGFTFDKSSNTLSVGNSTVNSIVNSSALTLGSTTVGRSSIQVTDLTVSGNLAITGTLTTISANNLTVTDSIIKLANGQATADVVDIGLYGQYGNSTVTKYTGLFRQASSADYILFKDVQAEPTTTVNTAAAGYALSSLTAYLKSGGLVSNGTNITLTANSTLAVALVANTLSLSSALGIGSGGTGLATITTNGVLYGNGAGPLGLATGTDGMVLASVSGVPTFVLIDGGTF